MKMFRAYEHLNHIHYNAILVNVTKLLVCRENQLTLTDTTEIIFWCEFAFRSLIRLAISNFQWFVKN